jgi:hypothetical protein
MNNLVSPIRPAVCVRYRGRLGNRLFEYAFGRALAESLGAELVAPTIAGFPNAKSKRFALSAMRRSSALLEGHWVEPEKLAALKSTRKIVLDGYFQRYEYVRALRPQIREWFRRGSTTPLSDDSLTIHVRSGDIWEMKGSLSRPVPPPHASYPALPVSYYRKIIESRPWKAAYLLCEKPDDPVARCLLDRGDVTFVGRDPLSDFDFLRSSRNIILSVSTFAWWAAWLSDASQIYFPLAGIFDPLQMERRKPQERIDLVPSSDERYHFAPLDVPSQWKGDASDLARVLSG